MIMNITWCLEGEFPLQRLGTGRTESRMIPVLTSFTVFLIILRFFPACTKGLEKVNPLAALDL